MAGEYQLMVVAEQLRSCAELHGATLRSNSVTR